MALVDGTNCGFVTVAPVADPSDSTVNMEGYAFSYKDASPATATKITEIGFWLDETGDDTNFEVGLYSDLGNGEPEARLYVDNTNATGGTTGWKSVAVDWDIDPNTTYWMCVQIDPHLGETSATDRNSSGGNGYAYKSGQSDLPADWGTSTGSDSNGMMAIYCVWEEAADTAFMTTNSGFWGALP